MRWQLRAAWELLRDVAATGTGLVIIWREVLYAPSHPSGLLLGTGLALTVPTVAAHLKALLPGGGGEQPYSEQSPPPSSRSPSSLSPKPPPGS